MLLGDTVYPLSKAYLSESMGDDECDLTRGGHFEPERASLAMIVAGNHAIIFHCMHYSGFQVLGTPLGALENRELLCWVLPDRKFHARHTATASRSLLVGVACLIKTLLYRLEDGRIFFNKGDKTMIHAHTV